MNRHLLRETLITEYACVRASVCVVEIIRINLGAALNLGEWARTRITQLSLISLNVLIREDCEVWLLSRSSSIAAVLFASQKSMKLHSGVIGERSKARGG